MIVLLLATRLGVRRLFWRYAAVVKAVQERCSVEVDGQGKPRVLRWRNRTYRVTREIDAWRAGGRWWLGEPSRDCWLLECGHLTVEVHRFDETQPPSEVSGWWVARVQD